MYLIWFDYGDIIYHRSNCADNPALCGFWHLWLDSWGNRCYYWISFRRFREWVWMSLENNPISYYSLLCHRCHLGYVWHRYYLTFHPRGFAAMRSHGDIIFAIKNRLKQKKWWRNKKSWCFYWIFWSLFPYYTCKL